MSTSPSPTTTWNFDTPENHVAWNAVTSTITYATNNNVNDTDCLHHSPGLDSNTVEQTTTLRDVEEAKAHFPTPTPGRLSKDSTGRPPILENGIGRMGGQLTIQSIRMTGAEEGSAGNTPHPNAAILFGGSEDEDDIIQCR
jgi:hypothetical protein